MVDNNTTTNNNIINLVNNTNRRSSSTTDHNNNSANLLSLIINQDHHHHHHHHHHDDDDGGDDSSGIFHEQLLLPIANVGRMMKQAVPANAKVSKEAKERVQECATEFLSFVTAEASDRCRRERRKTLNGDDVCWALQALGFDDYAAPLRLYLHRYRHAQQPDHRANAQDQTRATKAPADDVDGNKGGGRGGGDGCEE